MSTSPNLCALPHDILAVILESIKAVDAKSAFNFITCCKQLWGSDVLDSFFAECCTFDEGEFCSDHDVLAVFLHHYYALYSVPTNLYGTVSRAKIS